MMKYTIPTILTSIVLVAGIFAFMPIDEAITVHTTIQSSTTKIVSSTSASTAADDRDITITCPAGSDGCQILEVFITTTGDNTVLVNVDVNIGGTAVANLIDINPDDNVAAGTVGNVTELGGFAMASGDSVTLDAAGGGAGDRYTVTVIGIIEGDQTDFEFTIEA